jgi:outer membrane protein assembly factor BamB
LKWKFATSNLVATSPAIAHDGTIYFGSHDKFFYALTPAGKLKWKFLTGAEVDGSPAIGLDGTVYFSSTDGNLYALRPDGSERWRYRTGGYNESSPVLDADGNLYLMAGKKDFCLGADGKMRWWHPLELPMEMSPAVAANGQVYFSVPWLNISSLNATNCWPPVWNYQMTFNLNSSPNVSPQGIIYANDQAFLYALKPAASAPPAKSAWPLWRANAQHNGRVQKVN